MKLLICGGVAAARARLSRRVSGMVDVDDVEAAATVDDALSVLAVRNPDLILLDARLPGTGAAAVIRRVGVRRPRPVVLMLGGAEDADAIAEALVAGARGVLHRDFSHEELAASIAHMRGSQRGTSAQAARNAGAPPTGFGERVAVAASARAGARSPAYASASASAFGQVSIAVSGQRIAQPTPIPGAAGLTERERQVLHGMAQGRSNAEIGRGLYLSEDTVKTHAQRLFRKLKVNDRAHAVAAGFRQGLVS